MKRSLIERTDANSVFGIIGTVLLSLYALTIVGLLGWGLISSFKSITEFDYNVFGFPMNFNFNNYKSAISELYVRVRTAEGGQRLVYFPEMFLWSVLLSVVPTTINVLFTAICSYTLAKYKFKLGKVIYNVMLFVMILPIVGTLSSNLDFLYKIHMYGKLPWVLVSACTVWTGPWMILYAIYKGISWDYAEAAFIDGASHTRVFWKIMLPMSWPAVFVLILTNFITRWNDYQTTLVWFPRYPTVAYGLYYFQSTNANVAANPACQIAAAMLSAIPCFILFMIFKNKMMTSLTMGGLKG